MKTYTSVEIILLPVAKDDLLRTSPVSPQLWDEEQNGASWGEDKLLY